MKVIPSHVLRVFCFALAFGLAFALLAHLYWFYTVRRTMRILPPDTPTLSQYFVQTWTFPIGVAVVFAVLATVFYFGYVWLKGQGGT